MIERKGSALFCYLADDLTPTSREDAAIVRVVHDDGRTQWLFRVEADDKQKSD